MEEKQVITLEQLEELYRQYPSMRSIVFSESSFTIWLYNDLAEVKITAETGKLIYYQEVR